MTLARTAAAAAVSALVIAGCAGSSSKAGGGASSGTGQTLKLHTVPGPGGYVPLARQGGGDKRQLASFAKTQPVADASNRRLGFQDTLCFAGGIAGRANCRVTLTLERGTILAEGVFTDGGGHGGALAVVGGTGAYADARGTYEVSVPGPAPHAILVRLVVR